MDEEHERQEKFEHLTDKLETFAFEPLDYLSESQKSENFEEFEEFDGAGAHFEVIAHVFEGE